MIRCRFYARGNCRNGEACPFLHILQPEAVDLQQFDINTGVQSDRISRPNGQESLRSHGFNEHFQSSSQNYDRNRYKWVSPLLKGREVKVKMIHNQSGADEITRDSEAISKQRSSKERSGVDMFPDNRNGEIAIEETESKNSDGISLENNELTYDGCCNLMQQLYSKIEDLTDEEIKQFEQDEFEYGKIPIIPPPKELCF